MDEITGDESWARRVEDGWMLAIRVQAGARRSELAGPHGEELRVRVAAPAADDKANDELVRVLAAELGVRRHDVRIVRGQRSRSKTIAVRVRP